MPKSFEVFNTNRTKNEEVAQFALLELEINSYMKKINVVVMNLNSMDMFLEYNWFIKNNLEVNCNKRTI